MLNDSTLHALRYALPLITAAIALVSLNKKSADENRKPHPGFRWSMNGLILTALLVTLGIQFTDERRQERSTADQIRRNNELLSFMRAVRLDGAKRLRAFGATWRASIRLSGSTFHFNASRDLR